MIENISSERINLAGPWQFRIDGNSEWREIHIPSSWESQGISFQVEGPVTYRKEFMIPGEWAGRQMLLYFDAVSYACDVFCNSICLGSHQGLWTPFAFDISSVIIPGTRNTIEIEVYKPGNKPSSRYPVRSCLAGFLPDLGGTFGGIWQSVTISAHQAAIKNLRVSTEFVEKVIQVKCEGQIFSKPSAGLEWNLQIYYHDEIILDEQYPFHENNPLSRRLIIDPMHSWSPENPETYIVIISIVHGSIPYAHASRTVGFRKLSADRDQLLLNGKPYQVRGILSWGWNPSTIAPFYTLEDARAEITKIKEMGFNCIKLCLFVPNQYFFQAADEEGIILWQEFPMWLPDMRGELVERANIEYSEIADLTSHHPSVALYSLGCELNRSVDIALLSQLNTIVRGKVNDILLCDNSGSGESYGGLDIDFADFSDYHPYYDIHFFEPLLNHWQRDWLPSRPWIFGEFCDSDTLRDIEEIIQSNEGKKPWWMTPENSVTRWRSEAQALLDEKSRILKAGLESSIKDLIEISYKQAYIIRKYTLETLRKRSGIGGYVITGLVDTPISTSGLWDDLGRPKWTTASFQLINGEDILCLDTDRRRTWHSGGDRPDPVDPYNLVCGMPARWQVVLHCASHNFPLRSKLSWRLESLNGQVICKDDTTLTQSVQAGKPCRIASIDCDIPSFPQAQILRLSLKLSGKKRVVTNEWLIWAFPLAKHKTINTFLYDPTGLLSDWGEDISQLPKGIPNKPIKNPTILITTMWDFPVQKFLSDGGRVILLQQGDGPLPARRVPFWREAINMMHAHPIWDAFPHQGYSDMQFYGIASDIVFDRQNLMKAFPTGVHYRPVMQRLDAREFHLNDHIFEVQMGDGILLGCTLRLNGGAGAQPFGLKRNIAGSALLHAIIEYLSSMVSL